MSGSRKNKSQESSSEDHPNQYNITLDDAELNTINELIKTLNQKSLLSKKYTKAKYTLLKTSANEYFLIGQGKSKQGPDTNAFFGSSAKSRVKGAVPLKKTETDNYVMSNEIYAVKILNSKDTDIESFQKEVEIFRKIYGYAELVEGDNKKCYFILTRIPGTDLKNQNFGKISLDELTNLIVELLKALADMHSKGILHGDLQPGNVLYDEKKKNIYLTDFGLSKEFVDHFPENYGKKELFELKYLIEVSIIKYLDRHLTNIDFELISRTKLNNDVAELIDSLFDKKSGKINFSRISEQAIEKQLNEILSTMNLTQKISELIKPENTVSELKRLLFKCIASNNKEAFDSIVSYNEDTKQKIIKDYGDDLLNTAFSNYDNNLHYIQFLIQSGVNPNLIKSDGITGLMRAAQSNQSTLVEFLLQNNADVNLTDKNGKTALLYAIEKSHIDVAINLINHGANPDITDKNDVSAKSLAEKGKHEKLLDAINVKKSFGFLNKNYA